MVLMVVMMMVNIAERSSVHVLDCLLAFSLLAILDSLINYRQCSRLCSVLTAAAADRTMFD